MATMFLTHVVLITGRRLPRTLGALSLFDGDDGDELRGWGDEYRKRNGARVVVLRLIAQGGGQSLGALWVSGNGKNGASNWAIANVLPALVESGRFVASVDVIERGDGRLAAPDVDTTPAMLALWPSTWRFRRGPDGPEWIGGPLPAAQTPGNPPTGETIVIEALA